MTTELDFDSAKEKFVAMTLSILNNDDNDFGECFNRRYNALRNYLHFMNMCQLVDATYAIASNTTDISSSDIAAKLQNIAEVIDYK